MTRTVRCCCGRCHGGVVYAHGEDYIAAHPGALAPTPEGSPMADLLIDVLADFMEDDMTTPTQLSLAHLRADGWTVDICERWVPNGPGGGVRRDLFGLVDLVAVRDGVTMGVQTTSATNVAAHLRKMTDADHAGALAALGRAGWAVVIHGWRKSTREGRACGHGHKARCGCRWTLHRLVEVGR